MDTERINDLKESFNAYNQLGPAEIQELFTYINAMQLTIVCTYCGTRIVSKSIEAKMGDMINHIANCKMHPLPNLLAQVEELKQWKDIAIHQGLKIKSLEAKIKGRKNV